MKVFFTADTHFNHGQIIEYCDRPFSSVKVMNEALIARWNSRVGKKDFIYHLGDFGFGDGEEIVRQLNGFKVLILGSHDREEKWMAGHFIQVTQIKELRVDGQTIIMSHCAMRMWEKKHYGAWHLYGHSHGTIPSFGKSFDVGVDTHDFYPYSWDEVKRKMASLRDVVDIGGR